jgi:hypothetical protein
MTKVPFTQASITRIVKGLEAAGRFVVGVKPDGTMIVADQSLDRSSIVPSELEQSPRPKRPGEYFNGGAGEA